MACNLNKSPATNSIETCGGLPEEVHSAACHILENGGAGSDSAAIAAAVNFVTFVCKTGKSKNFLKSNPTHTVDPAKRARACASVAAWERLKVCMKGKPIVTGKAGGSDWKQMLLTIEMLNLADDLAIDHAGRAPIAPPADALEEAGLEPADAKALCHAGTCTLGGPHNMVDFEAGIKASIEEVDGGIIIKGLAADFSKDREDEAFEPGAFDASIAAFMRNPILTYNHATKVIGTKAGSSGYVQFGQVRVLDRRDDGLHMEAFIPRPTTDFMIDAYDKVKAGMMKGLSVGGRFLKHRTPDGWKIYQADLHEIAVAPKPINSNTLIHTVSAAKAMTDESVIWTPVESLADQVVTSHS